MSNKGLKQYTKQLSQSIKDLAKMYININKNDANLHIVVPLISSVGLNQIDTSLIFNFKDIANVTMFGRGFKLNYNNKLTDNTTIFTIKNSDGSTDEYLQSDLFKNEETQLQIFKVYDGTYQAPYHYEIKDKYGNEIDYYSDFEYPKYIKNKNGDMLTLDFVPTTKIINNGYGDEIRFYKTNTKITKVSYFHDNSEIIYAELGYDSNDFLTGIVTKNGSTIISNLSFSFSTSEVTVVDNISSYRVKYTLNYGRVISFIDGYDASFTDSHSTNITYDDNITKVEDYLGNTKYVVFDSDGMPLHELDSDGYVVKTEYDKGNKNLLKINNPVQVIHCEPNLFPSNINVFNNDNVTLASVSITDVLLDNIMGNTIYRATISGGVGELTYTTPFEGIATDDILLVMWGRQLTPKTDNSYVTVSLKTDQIESDSFKKEISDGLFDVMILGRSAETSFHNISVTIRLVGNSSIEIGGIQVIRKQFGSSYEYDSVSNVINIGNSGVSTSITYNSNNYPVESIGESSELLEYDYNNSGNVVNTSAAYGCKVENTYDSIYKSNLLTNKLINHANNKILEVNKTYTSDGRFLAEDKNELNYSTYYAHDAFGRITSITNALNAITSIDYNLNGTIQKIKTILGSDEAQAQYTYDSRQRLVQILISSQSKYNFTYDSNNRITQILLNNNVLFIYEYDSDGRVVTQKYGTNGDKYTFEYNSDNLVSKVRYVKTGGGLIKYKYTYTNLKQIDEVRDANNNVLIKYYYDSEGRVIKEVNGFVETRKQYDYLGEINQKSIIKDDGTTIDQSYDTVQRSQGSHPESILAPYTKNNEQYIGIFTNDASIISKDYIIQPINYQSPATPFSPQFDGVIPYIALDNTHSLSYVMSMASPFTETCGFVAFWFRPNAQYTSIKQQLFHCRADNAYDQIDLYLENSHVYLKVTSHSNVTTLLITSDYLVNYDDWNFIALDFINRDDGLGYNNVCEYVIMLNGHLQRFKQQNPRIYCDLGQTPIYNIGHKYVNYSLSYPLYGDVTCLLIGSRVYFLLDEIENFYRLSKDYFADNQLIDEETTTVDFSQTNLFTISQANRELFEIVPLQNSVVSLKGTRPTKYIIRNISKYDKDRTFNFNKLNKKYSYVADGCVLTYGLASGTNGTVMLRVYTDQIENKQYLFELVDHSNRKLGLYRGDDLKLYIDNNGNVIPTNLVLSSNEWHTVGLAYREVQSSRSLNFSRKYSVMVDNYIFNSGNEPHTLYMDFELYVGRAKNGVTEVTSFGSEVNCYPLHGQIEMLAFATEYVNNQTMLSFKNELVGITRIKAYDDFGMLKRTDVHKCGTNMMSNVYEYRPTNVVMNHISREVKYEKIYLNGTLLTNRSYYTDEVGNITTISDNVFGFRVYEYDYRGFLTKDHNTPISYWYNGNIATYGYTQFTYSSTIRDLLVSVGNKTITYDNKNLFNPISYDGKSYEYEGRRLVKFTDANNVVYNYKYNDRGLRIEKSGNGVTINYSYDGDKIISQRTTNQEIDYLYDEDNHLYGFIVDNASRYFYVRDILQNILGIVDENGNLVTKYDYNAYGNILSITGPLASTIGAINPFRYKGYYYDNESNMYYCNSRYYVPEWCRWLNADNPMYLDYNNNKCNNLFAYCNNNPISNADPIGKFGLLLPLLTPLIPSILAGISEYYLYKLGDSILKNEKIQQSLNLQELIKIGDNNIQIVGSWLLKDPISNFAYSFMLRNSKEYNAKYNDSNKSVRNTMGMWLEWEIHNIVGDLAAPLVIFGSLLSNGDKLFATVFKAFESCFNVDMENSKGWLRNIWERIKEVLS